MILNGARHQSAGSEVRGRILGIKIHCKRRESDLESDIIQLTVSATRLAVGVNLLQSRKHQVCTMPLRILEAPQGC
jgi:hypothetical protein